jgi:hypothetical protein
MCDKGSNGLQDNRGAPPPACAFTKSGRNSAAGAIPRALHHRGEVIGYHKDDGARGGQHRPGHPAQPRASRQHLLGEAATILTTLMARNSGAPIPVVGGIAIAASVVAACQMGSPHATAASSSPPRISECSRVNGGVVVRSTARLYPAGDDARLAD